MLCSGHTGSGMNEIHIAVLMSVRHGLSDMIITVEISEEFLSVPIINTQTSCRTFGISIATYRPIFKVFSHRHTVAYLVLLKFYRYSLVPGSGGLRSSQESAERRQGLAGAC